MKKKLSLALIMLLTAVTVLSGCGSKAATAEGSPGKEETENATEAAALSDAVV